MLTVRPQRSLRVEEAMTMSVTRTGFFRAMAGGMLLLSVHGCGGGGGDAIEPSGSSCGASGAAISLNHGHALLIASFDMDSIVDMTYSIRGSADHDHAVTLTVAQLRQLKASESVTAMASVSAAHLHVMTVTCMH